MAKRMRRGGSDPPKKGAGRGQRGATPTGHGHAKFTKFTVGQSSPAPNDTAKYTQDGDGGFVVPPCTCPAGPRCLPTCQKWRWFESIRKNALAVTSNPAWFGGLAGAAALLAAARIP